ncbi:hypothetical protein DXQ21_00205 [Listeria monocytogenes]|nr:hypothetical protein [Listeria monocytogenes]
MKIEFRGKATGSIEELEEIGIKHTNGWIYGSYIDDFIINGIVEVNDEYISIEQWSDVDPKTVGQYTTLRDKNGIKIFDGDRCWNDFEEAYGVIIFDEGKFQFEFDDAVMDLCDAVMDLEVIGNIYDVEVSE